MRFYLDEAEAGRIAQPQDLIVESKIFSFNAGSNDRGQFLRIFERGGGFPTGGSSLMIPNGLNNAYLRMFAECLQKITEQLGDEVGVWLWKAFAMRWMKVGGECLIAGLQGHS